MYLLVFNAYINEMHGSRNKIPSKKISSCSVVRRDLILALRGLMNQVKLTHHTIDHFGSVNYAELVDPMEENGNSK
jgi:hypothetical protein